jgi:hypothetical protein
MVPGRLLCDPTLADTAKLLWIVYKLSRTDVITPRLLEERSGYARHTVLRGLSQLAETGWLTADPAGPSVAMPEDLLRDTRLGSPAKLVYGIIQLTPGFQAGKGQFTYAQLAALSGMSHNAVKQAARQLHQTGWLGASRTNKLSPIRFELQNPVEAEQKAEVEAAMLRLEEANFSAEAIMKEILRLVVADRYYINNARPSYLRNPYTGQELEIDCYFAPDVGVEYNGAQHYRTTERFHSETKLLRQVARDAMKAAICQQAGVTLITIREEDLTVAAITEKVRGMLPLRNLQAHGPLVEYLNKVCRTYRESAERQRRRTAK